MKFVKEQWNIHTYWSLSSAHVTQQDCELLDRRAGNPLSVDIYPEGAWITLNPDWFPEPDDLPEDAVRNDPPPLPAADLRAYGYSQALVNLLRYCRDFGCPVLHLDQDADQDDDFPAFDW